MNKKRTIIYLLCIAAIFLAVIIKQRVVTAKREKKIASTFSEWQERGKPVVVEAVKKGNVRLFTKMTVVAAAGGEREYEGYVPTAVREKLMSGQEVFLKGNDGDEKPAGRVVDVAQVIDIDTGMFHIRVVLDDGASLEDRQVVYVHTGMFEDVICVSNDVLNKEGDRYVLWTAIGGRAHQKSVEVRERNGYGAIIHQGLDDGELLIVQGFTQLSENDMLNILDGSASGEI